MSVNFDDTKITFRSKSPRELQLSNFIFSIINKPFVVSMGTAIIKWALYFKLPIKWLIKATLFDQFCGGESIQGCEKKINQLRTFNVKTILDYSVEGQENEQSFDQTLKETLRAIEFADKHDAIPFCVLKLTGLGSKSLMTKIQLGKELTGIEQNQFSRFKARSFEVADVVLKLNQRLLIDAEESWYQDVVDTLSYELMIKCNTERATVYNTYQFYRRDMLDKMKAGFEKMSTSKVHFGAKIVRGAYMEQERFRAQSLGYPDPIQPNKEATDRDYNAGVKFAMENLTHFSFCLGTHNEASSKGLVELMQQYGCEKNDERIFFAQLLGMSDNISFKLSDEGYNVAKYVPYGPLEQVMPYLFRRAEENTSVQGQSSRELMLIKKEIKRRKLKL
ncbi:proline dehydrogenase family protein [Cyclobacteriaceae bacterium]|jgi:proline dehydrogenase|nr:proline dehydrogenase family protein [Cyclobacteriaceae bacterium]|tara:strand:- start:760 stop:1932 length:1173 start_codon:yes stop_codon:yes gene_type:complete